MNPMMTKTTSAMIERTTGRTNGVPPAIKTQPTVFTTTGCSSGALLIISATTVVKDWLMSAGERVWHVHPLTQNEGHDRSKYHDGLALHRFCNSDGVETLKVCVSR